MPQSFGGSFEDGGYGVAQDRRPPGSTSYTHPPNEACAAQRFQAPHFPQIDMSMPPQQPHPYINGSQLYGTPRGFGNLEGLDAFDGHVPGNVYMPPPGQTAAPRYGLPPSDPGLSRYSRPPGAVMDAASFFASRASRNSDQFADNYLHPSPAVRGVVTQPQTSHRLADLQSSRQPVTPPSYSGLHAYPNPLSESSTAHESSTDVEHSSPADRVGSRRRAVHASSQSAVYPSRSSPKVRVSALIDLPHAPPIASGIELISPRNVLPDRFRAVFPYELFNAVQSKCFSSLYESNDNIVVSAPTGSGKTVLLELAICRLVSMRSNENFKIIYQAPTKALCSERSQDWQMKFSHLNLRVAELTGDTSQAEMKRVGGASIIVTTPEKWDSVTRKWHDHRKLLEMVELFLVDEVHILKDVRGATLEAVVSRMKTIGANVRFVALSATVPNSDDIAKWLGRDHANPQIPARRETFGEDLRPVKLQKFVYGYDVNGNDYVFDSYLDKKLPMLLRQHSRKKPVLIFCFTRKSCENTARTLAEAWSVEPASDKTWKAPTARVPVVNRDLQKTIRYGVAFHHAGLDADDRNAVSRAFLDGQIGVICCTSTLAVGVNLPCHTVVLKGTTCFQDGKNVELSDLEAMQMLGRAGRPQFDDSAVAIILTRGQNKGRYEQMVSGQQVLESTLHLNLIEHLNSEIGLGTIKDLPSAKTWLSGTFLSVRLRRNPGHYRLAGVSPSHAQQTDERLEQICERDIRLLQSESLLTDVEPFWCTEYGRAMSKYMVQFETMKLVLRIPRGVGMRDLLHSLCQAVEFRDTRLKPNERALFRNLNKDPFILYPIRETVATAAHKVSLLIQSELGVVEFPSTKEFASMRKPLLGESSAALERMKRLVRCVIDCKGYDRDAIGVRTCLDLARALASRAWEGRPAQLRQVASIGPVAVRKLVQADVRTVHQLAEKEHDEIERILTRNPPSGKTIKDALAKFPQLTLKAEIVEQTKASPGDQDGPTVRVKAILGYANTKCPLWDSKSSAALTFTAETTSGTLAHFWRGSLKRLKKDSSAGSELLFSVALGDFDDRILCHFACEDIVGTIISQTLRHSLPVSAFATQGPRPAGPCRPNPAITLTDDGDVDDEDLLAAELALNTERASPQSDIGDFVEYPMVEDLLSVRPDEPESQRPSQEVHREPIRLPNGKWRCWHACTNGAPTASGKPCSHRCCREGLDRPRKPPEAQKPNKRHSEDGDLPALVPPTQKHMAGPNKRRKASSSALQKATLALSMPALPTQAFNLEDLDFDDDTVDLTHLEDSLGHRFRSESTVQVVSGQDSASSPTREHHTKGAVVAEYEKASQDQDNSGNLAFNALKDINGSALYSFDGDTSNAPTVDFDFGFGVMDSIAFEDTAAGLANTSVETGGGSAPLTPQDIMRYASRLLDLPSSPSSTSEKQKVPIEFQTPVDWHNVTTGSDILKGRPSCPVKDSPNDDERQVEVCGHSMTPSTLDKQAQASPAVPCKDGTHDPLGPRPAHKVKSTEEPAWVGEFDQDLINTFRPFVNFI